MGESFSDWWSARTPSTSSLPMKSTLASSDATSMFCDRSFWNRLMPDANRPVVWKYLSSPLTRWLDTMLGTWTVESDPSCQPRKNSCSAALRKRCSVSVLVTGLKRRTPMILRIVSPLPSSAYE